jgi:retinol-binding protein 3
MGSIPVVPTSPHRQGARCWIIMTETSDSGHDPVVHRIMLCSVSSTALIFLCLVASSASCLVRDRGQSSTAPTSSSAAPSGSAQARLEAASPPRTGDTAKGTLNETARREVITELARRIDTEYIHPSVGTTLVALLKQRLEMKAYERLSNPDEFTEQLTRDLQAASRDRHLNLFWSAEPIPPPLGDSPPPDKLEPLKKWTGGIRQLEVLDGNVGYMKLVGVGARPASEEAIAAAFAFLHHTDALIIDNRANTGGDPRTVMLYLSYLVDRPPFVVTRKVGRDGTVLEELGTTEISKFRYPSTKPVYILTSIGTFSAGAGMAYQLRLLGRATIIGEESERGTGYPRAIGVGHGVYAWIPYARSVSALAAMDPPNNRVKPDIEVAAQYALEEALRAAQQRLQAPGE